MKISQLQIIMLMGQASQDIGSQAESFQRDKNEPG